MLGALATRRNDHTAEVPDENEDSIGNCYSGPCFSPMATDLAVRCTCPGRWKTELRANARGALTEEISKARKCPGCNAGTGSCEHALQ